MNISGIYLVDTKLRAYCVKALFDAHVLSGGLPSAANRVSQPEGEGFL
jgi:hypothetical protein